MQPIVLHAIPTGTNPWKVAMVLGELEVPYTMKMLEWPDLKKAPYTDINPNGRVPAIEDTNTGELLWESGAIIQYLVETYDTQGTLSYSAGPEKHQIAQWLFFQASGQGPYWGQAIYFSHYHPEKIPQAISRYTNEIVRVISVLDNALKGKEYLVGGKCTVADLAFLTWNMKVKSVFGDEVAGVNVGEKFANWAAWNHRLMGRPAVQKVCQDIEKSTGGKY